MIYIILSPYDNEQADLIARVSENVHLEEIILYKYVYCVLGSIYCFTQFESYTLVTIGGIRDPKISSQKLY